MNVKSLLEQIFPLILHHDYGLVVVFELMLQHLYDEDALMIQHPVHDI